ncbi:MAG: AAA family ATPase, partial [Merdibacter sp.]
TGRAAKRLSELSGREASTLHSLLKWDLETNTFLKDEKDPLSSDVVIVDEFSMVDSLLFAALLKALCPQTKLLLIGDQDQLPSVSSGKVPGSSRADAFRFTAWIRSIVSLRAAASRRWRRPCETAAR